MPSHNSSLVIDDDVADAARTISSGDGSKPADIRTCARAWFSCVFSGDAGLLDACSGGGTGSALAG
jgi:hypothetical protein